MQKMWWRYWPQTLKYQNQTYLWIESLNIHTVCFSSMSTCLVYLFQKTKTSLGLVSCFIFSRLLEKNISHGIFYWQTKFHRQIAFTYIYGNICNEIICFQFYNVLNLNFETNLSLLIKSYFYMTKKVRQSFK